MDTRWRPIYLNSERTSEAPHERSLHLFCAEQKAVGRHRASVVACQAPTEAEAKWRRMSWSMRFSARSSFCCSSRKQKSWGQAASNSVNLLSCRIVHSVSAPTEEPSAVRVWLGDTRASMGSVGGPEGSRKTFVASRRAARAAVVEWWKAAMSTGPPVASPSGRPSKAVPRRPTSNEQGPKRVSLLDSPRAGDFSGPIKTKLSFSWHWSAHLARPGAALRTSGRKQDQWIWLKAFSESKVRRARSSSEECEGVSTQRESRGWDSHFMTRTPFTFKQQTDEKSFHPQKRRHILQRRMNGQQREKLLQHTFNFRSLIAATPRSSTPRSSMRPTKSTSCPFPPCPVLPDVFRHRFSKARSESFAHTSRSCARTSFYLVNRLVKFPVCQILVLFFQDPPVSASQPPAVTPSPCQCNSPLHAKVRACFPTPWRLYTDTTPECVQVFRSSCVAAHRVLES